MSDQISNRSKKMKTRITGEQIKANAKKLFLSYGFKSVSMDDLSKHTGISKKTICQYFADKDVLVHAIVNDLIQLHERLLNNFQAIAKDAIDEIVTLDTELFGIWTDIDHRFFYEVEKFFPEAWLELEYYSLKMRNIIIGNLEWGKKEGLYRNDINVVLIAELRMHQHISLIKSQFATTQKMSTDQLAKELTMLYLQSITTEKGKMLLNNYLKKEEY
jgi:AcrR family transcriptional regulator